ncbi:hypothetical protein [Kitasatospora fiedleri]|uniref:hypothetical protein n=1 Tax=Kitasatospora fiedleri TaxID=2991545 RepID=UPI002499E6A7|nr:hypothetical protein [Kitasatospora fiedleri]
MYDLRFADQAANTLSQLQTGPRADPVKLGKVRRALARLQTNPRHPGLRSHQYQAFPGYTDDKVWDSYVENNNPSAWRIYWKYGPDEQNDQGQNVPVITVLVIGPHP